MINLINRTNDTGHDLWSFNEILGHRRKKRGNSVKWKLHILWDNGESTWEPLSSIRHSDPVTVANYGASKKLLSLGGWRWAKAYVGDGSTIRLLKRVLRTNKKRLKEGTKYQFGVAVPRNTKQAYLFDKQNGDTLWADAIAEEMGKARLVAGGNHTSPGDTEEYAGVVSNEAVRIGMFLASLNDLDVLVGDVGNAYLHATTTEKVYSVAGPEFGELQGRTIKIIKSLYGLRSSHIQWRNYICDDLRSMGFTPEQGGF